MKFGNYSCSVFFTIFFAFALHSQNREHYVESGGYYLVDYDVEERFSDIFGQEHVKKEAAKIVDMIKNYQTYAELGGRIPNLITIQGPKGSGRMLLAKAIAGEADASLLFVDSLHKNANKIWGELIKQGPIVFIDRGRHLLKRNKREEDEDPYQKNYKLVLEIIKKQKPSVDEYPIVLIRTKKLFAPQFDSFYFHDGHEEDHDQEIYEKTIYVSHPDKPAREGLMKKYIDEKNVKLDPAICLNQLAQEIAQKTNSFSASHLKTLVNEAALCAGRDYSLYGNEKNYVEKKHFYESYHLLSRDVQTGSAGGTCFTDPFYYTYAEETRFSDVKGLDHVLTEVKEFIDILQNTEKYEKIGVRRPKGLLLEGLPGVGKTLIARAVAGEAECCFISASASQFQSAWVGSGQKSIRALFDFARQVAQIKPVVIFIDEFDSMGKRGGKQDGVTREYANMINELLRQLDGFEIDTKIMVFAATNNAEKLDPAIVRDGRFDRKVYVPLPCQDGRKEILLHYMNDVTCDEEINKKIFTSDLAKKCKGFTGASLRGLVNEAAILAIRSGADAVGEKHFLEAFKKIAIHAQHGVGGNGEEGFSYSFSQDKRFRDVIGIEEVLDEVQTFIDGIKNSEKYEKAGIGRPKGLLLYGKPGVGKTLLARAMAGEAGCCFISASASQFVKLYIGSGALAVRRLFNFARKMARNKSVIIFIDELDAFGKRSDRPGGSQEYNNTINELLTQLDGFAQDEKISIVGATNNISLIDDALLRDGRFDCKLEVPLPRMQSREKILDYYLKKIKTLDSKLVVEDLASKWAKETMGYSGAALESFVNKAASLALNQNCDSVHEKHFELAYLKSVLGLKNNIAQTKEELEKTAYHEAGHTLVSVLTGHEVSRVTILSRGSALGVMFQKDKHEIFSNNSRDNLLDEVKVLLGGFCAEKLIYDAVTPGAWDDLRKANKLVSDMINIYGMDDGPLAGITSDFIKSDTMKVKFDQCMMNTLKKCRESTQKLLRKNKEKLKKLAQALLEKETLLEREICAIIG